MLDFVSDDRMGKTKWQMLAIFNLVSKTWFNLVIRYVMEFQPICSKLVGSGKWLYILTVCVFEWMYVAKKFKGYLLFRVILFPIQDHLGAAEFCPANKIVQQNENKNINLTNEKTGMKKRN